MEVLIQKVNQDARLPEYAHPGDAGMDVFSSADVTIAPQQRIVVPTGIAMRIPEGNVGLVWDKSGRAVHDGVITIAGVIDSGYRGEVQIVLLNVSNEPVTIRMHEKIAQVLIQPVLSPQLHVTERLDETSRGAGGFGSTGLI